MDSNGHFTVGDKVKCIDGGYLPLNTNSPQLLRNVIYTVSEVGHWQNELPHMSIMGRFVCLEEFNMKFKENRFVLVKCYRCLNDEWDV